MEAAELAEQQAAAPRGGRRVRAGRGAIELGGADEARRLCRRQDVAAESALGRLRPERPCERRRRERRALRRASAHPASHTSSVDACVWICRGSSRTLAGDPSTAAPSDAGARMGDSPANGAEKTCSQRTLQQVATATVSVLESSRMAQLAPVASAAPVPPQNLEAEESVLGAMMISPGAIGAVSEIVDAGDFYRESHAKIYRAALALYAKGEPVDAITLTDQLEERGELEDVGGRVRLHELAALVPASANAAHYARIVHETATLRGLIRAGGEISRLGWERPGETGDLVDQAEQIIFDLSQQRVTGEFTHIDQLLKESFERITAAVRGRRRRDRHAVRLPRPRPAHLRLPAGQPDHRRGAPVDGEVGARALHGREHRRAPRHPRRDVHARDVEVRGDAAPHVQRGEGRVAAAPQRQARARTTGRG